MRNGSCDVVYTSGRKNSEGGWYWAATGQPLTYTYWGPTEPNNSGGNEDAVEFSNIGTYYWNDRENGGKFCSLCEIP